MLLAPSIQLDSMLLAVHRIANGGVLLTITLAQLAEAMHGELYKISASRLRPRRNPFQKVPPAHKDELSLQETWSTHHHWSPGAPMLWAGAPDMLQATARAHGWHNCSLMTCLHTARNCLQACFRAQLTETGFRLYGGRLQVSAIWVGPPLARARPALTSLFSESLQLAKAKAMLLPFMQPRIHVYSRRSTYYAL